MALPGLGTMRFGLRAKAVEDVNDVKASLIKTRRIIFTPTQELKDELADTAIQITCYDRNGEGEACDLSRPRYCGGSRG